MASTDGCPFCQHKAADHKLTDRKEGERSWVELGPCTICPCQGMEDK